MEELKNSCISFFDFVTTKKKNWIFLLQLLKAISKIRDWL